MHHDGLRFSSAKRGDHDEVDDFVQGKGQYTSDIDLSEQLYACFVRSPHASAVIRKIDSKVALAIPGVKLVLTGEELSKAGVGQIMPLAIFNGVDGKPMTQAGIPVLAYPQVRYVGEALPNSQQNI